MESSPLWLMMNVSSLLDSSFLQIAHLSTFITINTSFSLKLKHHIVNRQRNQRRNVNKCTLEMLAFIVNYKTNYSADLNHFLEDRQGFVKNVYISKIVGTVARRIYVSRVSVHGADRYI